MRGMVIFAFNSVIKDVDTDSKKSFLDEKDVREVITLWDQKENQYTQKFEFAKCFYIFSHNYGLALCRIKARKKNLRYRCGTICIATL